MSQDMTQGMTQTTPQGKAADITAQWLALEVATRARLAGKAGVATAQQGAGKTGLERMQAQLRGDAPYPYIADTMDFFLVDSSFGEAIFQGTPQIKHYNPMGGVHGGWFATIMDSAFGCAVLSTLPADYGFTTTELSLNIVRGANDKTGPLRAIGKILHSGRQLATAEAKIVDVNGKLYAHGTTTCMVFPIKAAT
jgi:uncharacterized protein (TIGR00369 family)